MPQKFNPKNASAIAWEIVRYLPQDVGAGMVDELAAKVTNYVLRANGDIFDAALHLEGAKNLPDMTRAVYRALYGVLRLWGDNRKGQAEAEAQGFNPMQIAMVSEVMMRQLETDRLAERAGDVAIRPYSMPCHPVISRPDHHAGKRSSNPARLPR